MTLSRSIEETLGRVLSNMDHDGPSVPGSSGGDGFQDASESNQYKPWLDLLMYCITGNMTSVLSVYLQTNLEDPQRMIMREMIEGGRMQASAACANRTAKLLELEDVLELMEDFRDTGELPEVDDDAGTKVSAELAVVRSELRMIALRHKNPRMAEAVGLRALASVNGTHRNGTAVQDEDDEENPMDAVIKEYIDAKCAVIQQEIDIISMKIAYEDARGVAVDYSGMKHAFETAGLSGLTGGQIEGILDSMPDGLRWAIEYGMSHTDNNDYVHQESIVGKVVGSRLGRVLGRNDKSRRRYRRRDDYNGGMPEPEYIE